MAIHTNSHCYLIVSQPPKPIRMNSIENFLFGPLGQSFSIIKQKGKLFTFKDFMPLTPDKVEKFNELSGMHETSLFCIGILNNGKIIEIVNELEMLSLIQASEFIRNTVREMNPQLSQEKQIIDAFDQEFHFITNIKVESKIYK